MDMLKEAEKKRGKLEYEVNGENLHGEVYLISSEVSIKYK